MLPTVRIGTSAVTRLVCGGNPIAGFSHFSPEMDLEMRSYYTMSHVHDLLEECWRQGINTIQTRGDHFTMRMYLEHRERGGQLQWVAQTASEFADLRANIAQIATYGAVAIYVHGTYTDNHWHARRMGDVTDLLKVIHDHGLTAGLGTHIPDVVLHAEERGWETDFYMCSLYNLARGYKSAPTAGANSAPREVFPPEDPPRMLAAIRQTAKPCLAFKLLAASRNCGTPHAVQQAFARALTGIRPTDALVVGMFQKHRNQVAENAAIVRDLLAQRA